MMKDKKNLESLKKANDAVDQAKTALNSVMQELDDDELDQVSGAGDSFEDFPRVPTQPITQKEREDI